VFGPAGRAAGKLRGRQGGTSLGEKFPGLRCSAGIVISALGWPGLVGAG